MDRITKRVADAYMAKMASQSRVKTAGEVRFIKDRSGDKGEWAWGPPGPNQREIDADFQFNPKYLKPLSLTLRSTLMAMGHALSAQNTFARIKSADVSPDGSLGGKGYIQKITDIRRGFMNIVEALSATADTLYDEIRAPHWHPEIEEMGPREREEVRNIMEDADEIRKDPEDWAAEAEGDAEAKMSKTARRIKRGIQ
jgi:hypothetical protein